MISTSMKVALVGVLGALANLKSVAAHGHVAAISIDGNYYAGMDPSNPTGISPIIPGDNADQGFKAPTSTELATNAPDNTAAGIHAAVSGGSTVQWFWNTWPSSHLGPITTYMTACPSTGCSTVDGNTASWFKVSEYDFDASGMWASGYLQAANNYGWQLTMPTDLAEGYYMIRTEIIAMHTTDAPQMYPVVFWAYLTSTGTTVPTTTGVFPAMYATDDEALTWDIYYGMDNSQFVAPGVALYETSLAGNSGPIANGTAVPTGTAITTDAGPGTGASTPAAPASPVAANSTSATVSSSASSVDSIPAASSVVSAGGASSSSMVGTSSSIVSPESSSVIGSSSSIVSPESVSASATIAPESATVPTSTSSPSTTSDPDDCDSEPLTITVTVPKAGATASASATASDPAGDESCPSTDDVITVTVTAALGGATAAASSTETDVTSPESTGIVDVASSSSSYLASSAAGGSGSSATDVAEASSTVNPYWAGSWGSATQPAAALATGGASSTCSCPTTRDFIERDAEPLIEEVYTRSGSKFLTRGMVFASELAARDACGSDCDLLSVSRRSVHSRWSRAL